MLDIKDDIGLFNTTGLVGSAKPVSGGGVPGIIDDAGLFGPPAAETNEFVETLKDVPKSLVRGLDRAASSAGAAMEMAHLPGGKYIRELFGERAEREEIAPPEKYQQGDVLSDPGRLIEPRWWVNTVGENIPNMLMMFAPASAAFRAAKAVGAGAKAVKAASIGGGMAGAFTIESGAAYDEARNEMLRMGYEEKEAERVATAEGVVVGLVNALLEVTPLGVWLNNPGGKKLLARVVRQGFLEGGTEAIQENVQMAVAELGHNPDVSTRDKIARTIEASLAGMAIGGGMGVFDGGKTADTGGGKDTDTDDRPNVPTIKTVDKIEDAEDGRPNVPVIKTKKQQELEAAWEAAQTDDLQKEEVEAKLSAAVTAEREAASAAAQKEEDDYWAEQESGIKEQRRKAAQKKAGMRAPTFEAPVDPARLDAEVQIIEDMLANNDITPAAAGKRLEKIRSLEDEAAERLSEERKQYWDKKRKELNLDYEQDDAVVEEAARKQPKTPKIGLAEWESEKTATGPVRAVEKDQNPVVAATGGETVAAANLKSEAAAQQGDTDKGGIPAAGVVEEVPPQAAEAVVDRRAHPDPGAAQIYAEYAETDRRKQPRWEGKPDRRQDTDTAKRIAGLSDARRVDRKAAVKGDDDGVVETDVRFSRKEKKSEEPAARWHSQMVNFLDEKLPGRGAPEAIKSTVDSWAKKGMIKQEELEWSGLNEWLDEQDGPVSKEDVKNFLAANHVQVEEVEKGGSDSWAVWDGEDEQYFETRQDATIYAHSMGLNANDDDVVFLREGTGYSDGTKFSQWQIPGGENYRELLLTMPGRPVDTDKISQEIYGKSMEQLSSAEQDRVLEINHRRANWIRKGDYHSTHFDEPNILAHVRFNERTDADGNRVLFLEEVQSDWHQAGRKKGYQGAPPDIGEMFWSQSRGQEVARLPDAPGQPEGTIRVQGESGAEFDVPITELQGGAVPNAPFKKSKNWGMLAIKRMVRYAAENGFDKIAWTPGDVQVDRYKEALRNAVDRVEWTKTKDGIQLVGSKNGREVVNTMEQENSVSDAIGKSMGDAIIESKDQSGVFEGDDITISDTGMAGFYDKILPAAVNKFFGKKVWGGARVGTTKFEVNPGEKDFDIPGIGKVDVPAKIAEVWSLPITPEMRTKALSEGMPLFSKKKAGAANKKTEAVKAAIGALQKAASTKALKSNIVETQDQLPDHLKKSIGEGNQVEAVFDKKSGKIHFVSENIADEKRAVQVWMHEQVGHHGLFSLFEDAGADFNEFIDYAWDTLFKHKRHRDLVAKVKEDYAADLKGKTEAEQRRIVVEEIMARRAESISPTRRKMIFQRFLDFINNWIRRITGLPHTKTKLTLTDLDALLEAARNKIIDGKVRDWLEMKHTDREYMDMAIEVFNKNPRSVTWYQNHQDIVDEVFGKDAPLFNILLGLTSPQAKAWNNAQWAVDTYLYLNGKADAVISKYPTNVKKSLDRILSGDLTFSNQYKVDEFIRGLTGDKKATTNDLWMHRAFFGPALLTVPRAMRVHSTAAREQFMKGLKEQGKISGKTKVPAAVNLSQYDPLFTMEENTASRHKLFQLAKKLTQETGHKWVPRDVQAAVWMKVNAEANNQSVEEFIWDYKEALTKYRSPKPPKGEQKHGGLTPLEYLRQQMGKTPIGQLHKKFNLPDKLYEPVSKLEKAHLKSLVDEGYVDTELVTGKAKLTHYVNELKASPFAHVLTIPTPSELAQMVKEGAQVFLTSDGKAGYTLSSDGDIQKVFNNTAEDVPSRGAALLIDAITRGGRTLDAFEPWLPGFYSQFGFQETWRYRFDPGQASDAWDIEKHGAHDVVGMALHDDLVKKWTKKNGRIDAASIRNDLGSFGPYRPGRYSDTGGYGTRRSYGRDFLNDRGDGARGGVKGDRTDEGPPASPGRADDDVRFSRRPTPIKPVNSKIDVDKVTGKQKVAFDPKGIDPSVPGIKNAAARLYRTFVMREYPIKRFAQKAGPEAEKLIEEQIRRRRGTGGIVESILTAENDAPFKALAKDGFSEYGHLGKTSLQKILQPLTTKETYQDYERLREAARDLALWEYRQDDIAAGKLTGIDPDNANAVMAALREKYGADGMARLQEISSQHTRFEQDAVMKVLLKSGWFSREQYDAIMDKPESEFYASFLREMEDVEKEVVGRGANPVKKIYGSEKKKIPSAEGTISNILRTVRLVEQQRLHREVVALRDRSPELAELIEEKKPVFRTTKITFPQRDQYNKFVKDANGNKVYKTRTVSVPVGAPKDTIVVAEDGKKRYYSLPADVLDALDGYSPKEMNAVFKLISIPTRLLRSGATLSAEFMLRNPARDQLSAYVYSKYGYNPFTDFIKGLVHTLGKTDLYREFRAAGAENSFFVSLDRQAVNVTARDMTGRPDLWKYVRNPVEGLRVLSELSEKGTRVGLYAKARKKGATTQEAMTEAREGTLDFGRIGTEKALNQIIAFWNASIQGTDKLFRELRHGRAQMKAVMGITIPSLILWSINHDEERYKELPGWRKNFFWNIIPEAIGLPADGPIISIPKPFELGLIFGSLPERILDWMYLKDPDAMKEISVAAAEGVMPSMIPTAALPLIEHITNYSFFMGRDLEPKSVQNLPNWMRYTSGTTNLARKAGEITNVSPIKLENWVRNWTGTLGYTALAGFDRAFADDGIPEVGKNWYEKTPGIRGFVAKSPDGSGSRTVSDFYEIGKDVLGAEAGVRFLAKTDTDEAKKYRDLEISKLVFAKRMRRDMRRMSAYRKRINQIINDRDMAPAEKRAAIEDLNKKITAVAKQFNERYYEKNNKKE